MTLISAAGRTRLRREGGWESEKVGQGGFTLIEILVVLLVVAVLIGYISLTPISDCRACRNEIQRLKMTMELVRDEAVLRYRPLALRIYPDHYLVEISREDAADLADLADLARTIPRGCRVFFPDGVDSVEVTFIAAGIATPLALEFVCKDEAVATMAISAGGAIKLGPDEAL